MVKPVKLDETRQRGGRSSGVAPRSGPRLPIVAGMAMLGGGTWLLSGISADGGYLTDLMPALIVSGLGLGTAFVAMSIGALERVEDRHSASPPA